MTLSNQLKSSTDEHGTDPEVESFTGKPAGQRRTGSAGIVLAAIVFLWPLLYFYRFLIPDRAFSLAVGNDFIWLYYKSQSLSIRSPRRGPLSALVAFRGSWVPFFIQARTPRRFTR